MIKLIKTTKYQVKHDVWSHSETNINHNVDTHLVKLYNHLYNRSNSITHIRLFVYGDIHQNV